MPAPAQLGPYTIVEEVGKGGMAVVYRARQISVERDVAIKVILKGIAWDPSAVQRFQREAKIIARLEHPHIVPVYDFDGTHEPPYIVMRYLDGGTLKDVMAQGLLPHNEVVSLMQQMCSALDYAHRQGIIHRDIKPSNILIDREGNAFVSDLGLARLIGSEGSGKQITEAGAIMGTPDYMSPEQAMGGEEMDHRADIYALGVMLFEMLTGSLPFEAASGMLMLMEHVQTPVPSLRENQPDLPEAIDSVLQRALAKDPTDRYQTAVDLSLAVSSVLSSSATGALPRLRAAAHSSLLLRRRKSSQVTPSEQNKTVTVVYIDAAEYGELLEEDHNAEAARQTLQQFWDRSLEIVQAYGGRMVERTERHLVALWGLMSSREDDAEQAARAVLQVHAALHEDARSMFSDSELLPLKVGIHTGLALLTPDETTDSVSASGPAVTLAARLADHAHGLILVSPDTYRHLRGVFDVAPADPLKLRGRKDPLPTYRLVAAKVRTLRLEAPQIEGIETALIGRQGELKQLQNAYLNAFEETETQVITLIGAAGLGKSRLLYEFSQWIDLREESIRIFQGRATPSMQQRPYGLLRDMLSFRFDILDSDVPAVVRGKLETGVAEMAAGDGEMAVFIGQLAGFDCSDSPFIQGILGDPPQIIRRAKQLFMRFIGQMCAQGPMVMYLDDLHYADDVTLDLLNELFAAQPALPLMILCSARPTLFDRRPDWGRGHAFHTALDLKALDKRDSRELVRELLQKMADVPKALRDLLVERAEGSPLYMEELVKMLIDDRVIVKTSSTVWTVEEARLSHLRVPPTLLGLLQARLDTLLYPERVVLQRAAVIGRVFYDTAISVIDPLDDVHLNYIPDLLAQLVARQVIHRRESSAFAGSVEYAFAQAMLRDALYDNLLRRQHRAYHHGAAQWLVNASGERQDEYLPLIANHYEQAEEKEKAAQYLLLAGEKAYAISALREAVVLLEHGLALAADTGPFLLMLGNLYYDLGQLDNAQARLDTILNRDSDPLLRAEALLVLMSVMIRRGQFDSAKTLLAQARSQVEVAQNPRLLCRFLSESAIFALVLSDYDQGEREANAALTLARDLKLNDRILVNLNSLAIVYASTQRVDLAFRVYQEGAALARQLGNRSRLVLFLGNWGDVARTQGALDEAEPLTREAVNIAHELGDQISECIYVSNLGLIALGRGEFDVAETTLKQALQQGLRNGFTSLVVSFIGNFGELIVRRGDPARGLTLIGLAFAHPAADFNIHSESKPILMRLRQELGDAAVEAGLEKGSRLDFDTTVEALLAE